MFTFGQHSQQGSNVWYCPQSPLPVERKDEKPGYPAYSARVCPVCGEHAKPAPIK